MAERMTTSGKTRYISFASSVYLSAVQAVHLLVSFSSVLKKRTIFSPSSPSGTRTSSLVSPSSLMSERKPSSEMSSWKVGALACNFGGVNRRAGVESL